MAWDLKFGPENQLRDSPTVKFRKTSRGIFAEAVVRVGVGTPQQSTGYASYTFVKSYANYLLCSDSKGKHFRVAKTYKLRNNITQEIIYGIQINYTYPHNVAGDQYYGMYRIATAAGGQSENQGIDPQWLNTDTIAALSVPGGVDGLVVEQQDITDNPGDNVTLQTSITLIELSSRAWMKFSNQSF